MSETTKASRLPEIIEILKKTYPPAISSDEAEMELTTDEIIKAIYNLDPHFDPASEDIFQLLKATGYTYAPLIENEKLVFKWLVGEC